MSDQQKMQKTYLLNVREEEKKNLFINAGEKDKIVKLLFSESQRKN